MRGLLKVAAAAAAAAATLALAGCGGSSPAATPETAVASPPAVIPTPPVADPTAPVPGGSSPTVPAETEPLAGVDACALLPDADAARLGLTDREAKTVGEARVCRWRHEGATLTDSYTVGVEIFEQRGLDEIVGTDLQPITIGDRPAISSISPGGGCRVSLEVGPSARVDTTAVGGDEAGACRLADDLAEAVEPSLP